MANDPTCETKVLGLPTTLSWEVEQTSIGFESKDLLIKTEVVPNTFTELQGSDASHSVLSDTSEDSLRNG